MVFDTVCYLFVTLKLFKTNRLNTGIKNYGYYIAYSKKIVNGSKKMLNGAKKDGHQKIFIIKERKGPNSVTLA